MPEQMECHGPAVCPFVGTIARLEQRIDQLEQAVNGHTQATNANTTAMTEMRIAMERMQTQITERQRAADAGGVSVRWLLAFLLGPILTLLAGWVFSRIIR